MLKPDQRSEEDKGVQNFNRRIVQNAKMWPWCTEKQLDADQTETKHPDKDQVLPAGRAVYPPSRQEGRLERVNLFLNVGAKHK